MSKNDCSKRFKGVENFLRRVAFNLGNTPSQTEVKIISCIPIDVTDLQQKIIQLEKQLETVNGNEKTTISQRKTSTIHTAICNPPCFKYSNARISCKGISCHNSSISLHNQNCPAKQKKSTTSFIYPTGQNSKTQNCFYSTDVSEMTYTKKQHATEGKKNFFNKRKAPKRKKFKTQFVYYAQTDDKTPFNCYGLADDGTSKRPFNEESKDMVRKHYKPGSVASQFSTPICRDIITSTRVVPEPRSYESDMCSCCHGQFQNIDKQISKNHFVTFSSSTGSNNAYNDSNLYDIVPVKENAVKIKNIELPKRKERKNLMDIACCPGNVRFRYKVSPMVVNYNTTTPTLQHVRKAPVKSHSRKEKVLSKMSKKTAFCCPVNRQISKTKVSNSRSVEFSEVYAKRLERNRRKTSKSKPTKVTNRKDAACLTTVIANTECQTETATRTNSPENKNEDAANVTPSEDNTNVTLNQIKDILQSVLTEVKTNSKIRNNRVQIKKKDAVIQNGLSQSNIYGATSSLLQTFTYDPYGMDTCGPSCSQQMQTSSLCYHNISPSPEHPVKCLQHYPLFVQSGRNMCDSCYKDKTQLNKLPNMKRAASTATNTEDPRARSRETETLIKEIYKAIALNIEIPTEDKSMNEHGDINHTIQKYNKRTEDGEGKHISKVISEIFKNSNTINTSVSQNTGSPSEIKLASNETSFRSQTRKRYAQSMNESSKHYYNTNVNSKTIDNNEIEQASRKFESDEESDVTIVNEETESSVSETESEDDDDDDGDDVVLPVEEPNKKKKKKWLFSKMLSIFRPRSKKTNTYKGGDKDNSSGSDSVDYRIVQRHKDVSKSKPKPNTSKSRGIVFYSKPSQPRNQSPKSLSQRSPPYMEQEYRRCFDEKLTFHDNQHRKSSTREPPPPKRPVYYQQVETRSALVDHYTPRKEVRQNSRGINAKSKKRYMSRNHSNQEENYPCVQYNTPKRVSIVPPEAITWLEKHKLGIHCGKQWKKLILDG